MSNINETPNTDARRIAVILAGGGGRRMGGADKGELMLGGRRLVDHVLARLKPQADQILFSGAHDYGTGLTVVADLENGPRGPAAGLWAAVNWIEKNAPHADGFLTAPVDGPFIPGDLFELLSSAPKSALACTADGAHPTFAYWLCDALHGALSTTSTGYGIPLKELADSVHAERMLFDNANAFLNINTREELEHAEKMLSA